MRSGGTPDIDLWGEILAAEKFQLKKLIEPEYDQFKYVLRLWR